MCPQWGLSIPLVFDAHAFKVEEDILCGHGRGLGLSIPNVFFLARVDSMRLMCFLARVWIVSALFLYTKAYVFVWFNSAATGVSLSYIIIV